MAEYPCDEWQGVGSIKYDDFWSPCTICGYSWRSHYEKKKREEKIVSEKTGNRAADIKYTEKVLVAEKRVAATLILTNRFDDMSVGEFRKLVAHIVQEAKAKKDHD